MPQVEAAAIGRTAYNQSWAAVRHLPTHMDAHAGDHDLERSGREMAAALAACQAKIGNGYVSAYPEELYDRLKDGRKVWAPFYTYHKILAGHLDLYALTGNTDALAVAERMAGWVRHWLNGVSDAHLQRILQTEYGGMFAVTCSPSMRSESPLPVNVTPDT